MKPLKAWEIVLLAVLVGAAWWCVYQLLINTN